MGASVLSWGVLGIVRAMPSDRITVVRIGITAIHVLVALLFIRRIPFSRQTGLTGVLLCLPSFLAGGILFRLSANPSVWPWYAQTVFALGWLLAVVTLANLGRSFAVMPAVRRLVTTGVYSRLRHPAYLGELLMAMACVLATRSLPAAAAFAVVLPLMVLRIVVEERLWQTDSSYRNYAQQVKYRLVPFIW